MCGCNDIVKGIAHAVISQASLPPKEVTAALIAEISDLHFNSKIEHSTVVKLNPSFASIDRGQTVPAINKRKAGKSRSRPKAGKKITTFDADDLIPEIEKIIQRL